MKTYPYITLNEADACRYLSLLKYVMTAGQPQQASDYCYAHLTEIRDQLLQHPTINLQALPQAGYDDYAALAISKERADKMTRILVISSVIEGVRDENNAIIPQRLPTENLAIVLRYAKQLGVNFRYLTAMQTIYDGDVDAAFAQMKIDSINEQFHFHVDQVDALDPAVFPYHDNPDPALVKRFEALQHLPKDTLGYLFWQHYKKSNFTFPGDPDCFDCYFATLHDTAHLLSGYDTSFIGEMNVASFILTWHHAAEITWQLPFFLCWQLGYPVYDHNNIRTGLADLPRFWEAWMRGYHSSHDLFADKTWDFWQHAETPIAQLRQYHHIPPLRPGDFPSRLPA